jgi:hypothetical protein
MLAHNELVYYVAHWHSEQLIYRFGTEHFGTEQVIYNTRKILPSRHFHIDVYGGTNTMEPCS